MSIEDEDLNKLPISAFVRSLRPHQWTKNILIFIPLLLAGKAGDSAVWLNSLLGFTGFTLVASSMYLVNDVRDLPLDRLHWSKKNRPLARGDLSVTAALVGATLGIAIGLACTLIIGFGAFAVAFSYMALSGAYSLQLRQVAIFDVLTLASLYTLRLVFGVYAAAVALSPWLLVFSMFIFTSLCFAKRYTEIEKWSGNGETAIKGRGYVSRDGPFLLAFGTSSAAGAVLIMILYLIEEAFNANFYTNPAWLWCLPPILFLWLGRIWLLAGRDDLDDDPIRFAIGDKTSLALGGAMIIAFLAAWKL